MVLMQEMTISPGDGLSSRKTSDGSFPNANTQGTILLLLSFSLRLAALSDRFSLSVLTAVFFVFFVLVSFDFDMFFNFRLFHAK